MPETSAPHGSRNNPSDTSFTVLLPRDESAPGALRNMVGRIAPRCEATEIAQLLGTEVVTNALIHAPPDVVSQIAVAARLRPPSIYVEVTGEGEFREEFEADRQTGGYGLALVEALSESWGIRRSDSAVTVWFTVGGFPTEA